MNVLVGIQPSKNKKKTNLVRPSQHSQFERSVSPPPYEHAKIVKYVLFKNNNYWKYPRAERIDRNTR